MAPAHSSFVFSRMQMLLVRHGDGCLSQRFVQTYRFIPAKALRAPSLCYTTGRDRAGTERIAVIRPQCTSSTHPTLPSWSERWTDAFVFCRTHTYLHDWELPLRSTDVMFVAVLYSKQRPDKQLYVFSTRRRFVTDCRGNDPPRAGTPRGVPAFANFERLSPRR